MIARTSELANLATKELQMFWRYQVDAKDIKCLLEWWGKYDSFFPIVAFLAHQILGIVKSQIEIEKIFSLANILINLRRCKLQKNNLDKLMFISKN
jgi:hypothetical protein